MNAQPDSKYLFTLIMVFLGSTIVAAQTRVKFKKQDLTQGVLCEVKEDANHRQIVESGVWSDNTADLSTHRKFEILKTKDGRAVEARVDFTKWVRKDRSRKDGFGTTHLFRSTLADERFKLKIAEDGRTLITAYATGRMTSKYQHEELESEFGAEVRKGSLIDPHMHLAKHLVGRSFTKNKPFVIAGQDAERIACGDRDGRIGLKDLSLTYKRTKKIEGIKCAIFEVRLRFDPEQREALLPGIDGEEVADVTGEAAVGVNNAWVYAFRYSGLRSFYGSSADKKKSRPHTRVVVESKRTYRWTVPKKKRGKK